MIYKLDESAFAKSRERVSMVDDLKNISDKQAGRSHGSLDGSKKLIVRSDALEKFSKIYPGKKLRENKPSIHSRTKVEPFIYAQSIDPKDIEINQQEFECPPKLSFMNNDESRKEFEARYAEISQEIAQGSLSFNNMVNYQLSSVQKIEHPRRERSKGDTPHTDQAFIMAQ